MWNTAFRVSTQRVTDALLRKPVLPAGAKPFERISGALCVRAALLARGAEQSLVFAVPEATAHVARQVTAALLVGDHAHAHGAGELPPEEARRLLRGDVLLVSQAVSETKSVLDELPIGSYQKLKDCWDVVLASRYAGAQKTDKPRLLVANPGWMAKSAAGRRFGAVVIDASHPRTLEQLPDLLRTARGCTSLRVVVAPPVQETTLRKWGCTSDAVWLWDPDSQAEAALATETTVADSPRVGERKLWVCDSDSEAADALARLYRALCAAAKAAAGGYYPGLQQAWSIYNRLRQLVVPLAHFEQAAAGTWAGNLRARVDELALVAGHGSVAWETTWPQVLEAVLAAYDTLLKREETTKFWGMASTLEKFISGNERLLRIVVPSEAEADLMTPLLGHLVDGFAGALAAGRLEVVTASQEARLVAEGQPAPTVLLGPRSKNRYLDAFPSNRVDVLVYPHEVGVEKGQLAKLYEPWTRANHDSRTSLLASYGLRPVRPPGQATVPACASPAPIQVLHADGHEVSESVRSSTTWDIDLDALAGVGDTTPFESHSSLPTQAGDTVEVVFTNGSSATYYSTQNVDVFFPATQTLQRYAPQELKQGWKVVSFVDGRYDTLYERLRDIVAARRPQKERLELELWDAVKRKMAAAHPNKRQLHQKLVLHGLKTGYETFTSWLREGDEEVVAPRHFEEFEILAAESGAFSTPERLRATFNAVQRERGTNRAAGRTLKNFLRAVVSGDGYDEALSSARKLDAALGDVLHAVEVLEVAGTRVIRRSQ
jgi:hypothetical protein